MLRVFTLLILGPLVTAIACGSATHAPPTATRLASLPSASTTSTGSAAAAATMAASPATTAIPTPAATAAATTTRAPTPMPRPTASPSPTLHPDETRVAQAMLLTVNDFPTGWAETPSDSSTPSALDRCDPGDSPGLTGKAETGDFSSGGAATISENVALFATAQDAAASLARFTTLADCLVTVINKGNLDDSSAAYSAATYGPVSFPQSGDETHAYRVTFHVKVKGQAGFGSEGDAYFDVVYVRLGRANLSLETSDIFSPFDTDQLQQFTATALTRVQQHLPAQ